jgi:membrane protein implicated in regulation of membrane protease activity
MFDFLTMAGFQPFVTAGLVLVGLCVIEAVSLMFGHSVSGTVDHLLGIDHAEADVHADIAPHSIPGGSVLDLHADASHSNLFGTFYDWVNAGRVPLLILLMAALGAFSVVGLAIQIVAMHATPAPLPTVVAALLAFLAVIPTTRGTSRLLARFLPRDESYAIDEQDLIGRTGVVSLGPVEAESAGRAKVMDAHGNAHFPRVRAARAGLVIAQGVTILVVDRVGSELTVVPAEERLLGKSL